MQAQTVQYCVELRHRYLELERSAPMNQYPKHRWLSEIEKRGEFP
jgi:hypothetical protein